MSDLPPNEIRVQTENRFESSRVKNKPDGWISPNGVFYGCAPEEHDKCANFLLERHKEYIDLQLIKNEKYTMRGWQAEEIAAREKLKAAGFALLSDDQLSESNLPESLSLRQMEFAKRNELVFAPQSGQLEVEQYQAFKEEVRNWEGVNRLLERKNKAVTKFMNDPTRTLYVADNDSFAEKVFNALTEKTSGEISLKLLKEKLTWKKLDIPGHDDIYVEYHYHNHGYDATPETEAFIMLTNKKSIKEYLEEKRKKGNVPKGDLSLLTN